MIYYIARTLPSGEALRANPSSNVHLFATSPVGTFHALLLASERDGATDIVAFLDPERSRDRESLHRRCAAFCLGLPDDAVEHVSLEEVTLAELYRSASGCYSGGPTAWYLNEYFALGRVHEHLGPSPRRAPVFEERIAAFDPAGSGLARRAQTALEAARAKDRPDCYLVMTESAAFAAEVQRQLVLSHRAELRSGRRVTTVEGCPWNQDEFEEMLKNLRGTSLEVAIHGSCVRDRPETARRGLSQWAQAMREKKLTGSVFVRAAGDRKTQEFVTSCLEGLTVALIRDPEGASGER